MEFLLKLGLYGIYLIVALFIALVIYVVRINRKLSSVIHELDKIAPKQILQRSKSRSRKYRGSGIHKFFAKINKAIQSIKFERYLKEYFIAANFITVVGSLILLVGIGFFVRYSIIDIWINITGRIILALIASGSLLLLAHQLRNKQKAFSSIITGTALGILYYVFASAYYNHHLFSTSNAFIITITITAFSVLLSFFYDRVSLAVLSVLAAYTAPFLIDYNQSQVEPLFTYILVLNIGVLIIVFFKKNLFLNILASTFTGIFMIIWLLTTYKYNQTDNYNTAFLYITLLYLILFPINTISKIRLSEKFIAYELSMVIVINTIYYLAGGVLLDVLNPDYKGVFTAFVAVINLLYLFILLNNKRVDKGLIFMMIGIVIVYLSLIAPIEFVGKTLNIVWALQMVLLLWVAQKLDIKAFRFYSALYILVVIINTFYELYQTYNNISPQAELKTLFINIDFISGLIGSLALLFCFYLVGKEHKIYYLKPLKMSLYQAVVSIFAVIIIYFNIYIEISYHITIIYESELVHKIILGIYNFGFMLLISTPFLFIKVKKAKLIGGVLVSISILFYFFYYTLIIIQSRDELLASAGISQYQFWSHLIISALVVILAFSTYLNFRKICINHKFLSAFTIWPAIFIVLAVLSFELDHIWIFSMSENNIATADILEKVHRMPYTLLWSVFAAFLTLIGTIINYKQLRQVSLFIVFCALVKLFIDLQYMNIANKTASLIGMGGILLVIAFIYQFNSSKITNND